VAALRPGACRGGIVTLRNRRDLQALAGRVGHRQPAPPWRVVSCAKPPAPALGPEVSEGAQGYRLRQWFDQVGDAAALNDRLSLDIHGEFSTTHVDARSHFYAEGLGAGGLPQPDLRADELRNDVRDLLPGVVGRGVLLDLAGSASPSDPIPLERVLAQCEEVGVMPRSGDTLYLRIGSPPLPAGSPGWYDDLPGLSIDCAEWMLDIGPAAVVSDLGLDPAPSEVAGVRSPWHELLLIYAGIPLVDLAALDDLAQACREEATVTFLSVIAPLALPHASGSPVNPLAIFHPDFTSQSGS
jgi:kynurenine formamidase